MLGKTASLVIQTPEGVTFQLPLASPVSRGLALMIDFVIIAAIISALSILFAVFNSFFLALPVIGPILRDFASGVLIILQFLLVMLYGAFFEWSWKGQTVGKRVMNLRVVDERGLSLTPGQIVIRNLFRILDMLPGLYLLGGLSSVITIRCQRIGDIAAGTVVIREMAVRPPDLGEILEKTENSFASAPHIEARLRQNATPEDARIALDAVLRRNELGDRERLRVFRALAEHFREKAEFPEAMTLGLSDEQYVRNAVATLFRRSGRG